MFWQYGTKYPKALWRDLHTSIYIFKSVVFACGGDGMLEKSKYKYSVLNFMGGKRVRHKTKMMYATRKRLEDDAVHGYYWSHKFERMSMLAGPWIVAGKYTVMIRKKANQENIEWNICKPHVCIPTFVANLNFRYLLVNGFAFTFLTDDALGGMFPLEKVIEHLKRTK